MRADVLNTAKAQAEVGANPHHRIFLAVGAGVCDSRLSTAVRSQRPALG